MFKSFNLQKCLGRRYVGLRVSKTHRNSYHIAFFFHVPLSSLKKQKLVTPARSNMSPKMNYFNRKRIFQPLIFRFHVNFPGCSAPWFQQKKQRTPDKLESKKLSIHKTHESQSTWCFNAWLLYLLPWSLTLRPWKMDAWNMILSLWVRITLFVGELLNFRGVSPSSWLPRNPGITY